MTNTHNFNILFIFYLTSSIKTLISEQLKRILTSTIIPEKAFGKHFKEMNIEFKEAAASSLNVQIVCAFTGEAADDYFSIGQFIQGVIVETCSSKQWNIPYNQITVNMNNETS